jgi:hypothetical protein
LRHIEKSTIDITRQLTNMLISRDGIESVEVEPTEKITITSDKGDKIELTGPVKIIVDQN